MAKFFIPILAFLIALWIYVVVQEQDNVKSKDNENVLLKKVEDYTNLRDSIKKLPAYSDFFETSYNRISFMVPLYLDTTTKLSESAVLQYKNYQKEFYLELYQYVYDEYSRYQSVESYFNATLDVIRGIVINFQVVDSSFTKINKCLVYSVNITGILSNGNDSVTLWYKVLVTQMDNFFYDLTVWTTIENFDKNEEDLNKIISSVFYKPDIDAIRNKLQNQ